jgi:hypothetical protein
MGAIVNLIIGIVIAFLPLFIKIGQVNLVRTSRDNVLSIILVLLCFLLPDKKRRIPLSMVITLTYGLFCIVLNHWNPASIYVMFQSFYIAIALIFFVAFYEKHSRFKLNYIADGMAIGCLIQSGIVLVNFAGFNLWHWFVELIYPNVHVLGIVTKGIGSLDNTNLLAAYVSITIFSLFRRRWHNFIPLPMIALIIADSAMGYLTFIGGAFYYLNLQFNIVKKFWLYLGASFGMIAIFFTGARGMDSERFMHWRQFLGNVTPKQFWIGNGPGWFADVGIIIGNGQRMEQEHNEFLSLFNAFGIIGGLLLFFVFYKFLITKDRTKVFPTILFAAFINSYGHFSLHQSTVAIIIIVTAAICLAEGNKHVVNVEW